MAHFGKVEATLLGLFLMDPDLIEHVRTELEGAEFTEAGEQVYEAMLTVRDRVLDVDFLNTASVLEERGQSVLPLYEALQALGKPVPA